MFQVESNAQRNAQARRDTLVAEGHSEWSAAKIATEEMAKEIEAGNKWITENVGLN